MFARLVGLVLIGLLLACGPQKNLHPRFESMPLPANAKVYNVRDRGNFYDIQVIIKTDKTSSEQMVEIAKVLAKEAGVKVYVFYCHDVSSPPQCLDESLDMTP